MIRHSLHISIITVDILFLIMRDVYVKNNVGGFQTPKVDSICAPNLGNNLFVSTSEGALARYECQYGSSTERGTRQVDCSFTDFMRRAPRDKKLLTSLKFIGAWNAILGIADSFIVVYDSDNFTALGQINESKGVTSFSVHDRTSLLCTISKRKISLFLWQGFGFIMRREIPLSNTPLVSYCLDGLVILGHKKWYDAIETSSYTSSKLIDVEKEHKMVCAELPGTTTRPRSVLISASSVSGTLLVHRSSTGSASGLTHDENSRMEWSSAVVDVEVQMPFIVSLISDAIEIHDVGTLSLLQRIPLIGAVSLSTSGFTGGRSRSKGLGIFASTQDQLFHFSMIPINVQIQNLMHSNAFEEALALCTINEEQNAAVDGNQSISLNQIRERYAFSLHQKGDFEGAITQYLAALTAPAHVIALFPDLIPQSLVTALMSAPSACGSNPATLGLSAVTPPLIPPTKLTSLILPRAASALLSFCEQVRAEVTKAADLAIQQRVRAAQTNLTNILQDNPIEVRDMGAHDSGERVRTAVLLDTVLMTANLACNPPRKQAVIDLVSDRNRCHVDSCSVILLSHTNAYIEAVLGLYRSHGEHKKVFSHLSEDTCEGVGAWTKEQYYSWTSDYLCWLWYQSDPSLAALVLQYVDQVIKYDAELGVTVFMSLKAAKSAAATSLSNEQSLGGATIPFTEVVAFLRKIPVSQMGSAQKTAAASKSGVKKTGHHQRTTVASALMASSFAWLPRSPMLPIVDGDSLALVYLEWLTMNTSLDAEMAPIIHEEYAKLLMGKIPLLSSVNHASNDLVVTPQDSEELKMYKVIRTKLQTLLQASDQYRAERIIEFLQPQFLHEYALLLSRMNCHEEVLQVYVHFLNDLPLAEKYCGGLYGEAKRREAQQWIDAGDNLSSNVAENAEKEKSFKAQDIYLILLKILLCPPSALASTSSRIREVVKLVPSTATTLPNTIDPNRLKMVMETAERHCDKIDCCAFLDMLPKNVPVASVVNFVAVAMESATAKQHNLQIIYQLLRMREVNIRTSAPPEP